MTVPTGPQTVRLCDSLIKELFGDVVQKVSHVLTSRGQQTLQEVVRASQLPTSTVRTALLVLLQHNFVVAHLVQPEAGLRAPPPDYHVYRADTAAIIQILRRPRMLQLVQQEYGGSSDDEDGTPDLALRLVEALLEHGRLRLDQLLAAVAVKLEAAPEDIKERLHARFAALLSGRFLERANPCGLPPLRQAPIVKTQARKTAPKAGSQAKAAQEVEALRHLADNTYQKERFSLPPDVLGLSSSAAGVRVGAKRKKDDFKAGQSTAQPLWRVNVETFNSRLRDEACVQYLCEIEGREAGAVVSAVLRCAAQQQSASAGGGRGGGGGVTPAIPVAAAAAVLGQMRKLQPELPTMSAAGVAKVLSDLASDGDGPIQKAPHSRDAYTVSIRTMVSALRQRHIEAVIRDRFSLIGMRIFRLLLAKKQLEQKQVADFAMLPQKDARELLYRMLQAGYVSLQDVPKGADHAPARTFYTWHIDRSSVTKRMAAELIQAAGNLRARLHHELSNHAEVLGRVEAGETALLQREREEANRIRRMSVLLDTRLIALDPLIALFHDF